MEGETFHPSCHNYVRRVGIPTSVGLLLVTGMFHSVALATARIIKAKVKQNLT
jgi:hypothetical protein